ncbi:hypothetical protein [Micromonospora sp. IBHARD004]|uniref:hypothetical protein n=1 Tax=Micromonospora sp. IBHARD004 TaxID=3457764 RepID=UPI004058B632
MIRIELDEPTLARTRIATSPLRATEELVALALARRLVAGEGFAAAAPALAAELAVPIPPHPGPTPRPPR